MKWLIAAFLLSAAVSAQASQPPAPGGRDSNRQEKQDSGSQSTPAQPSQNQSPVVMNVTVTQPETQNPNPNHGADYYGTVADWLMVGLTFLTFGATVVLVVVAIRQFRTQTEQTAKALSYAKDGLDETVRAAKLDKRAWMTIHRIYAMRLPEPGKNLLVRITTVNSGNSPALQLVFTATVATLPANAPFDFTKTVFDIGPKASRSVLGQGGHSSFFVDMHIPTKAHAEMLLNGSMVLFVCGTLHYDDIFGESHRTRFAYFLSGEKWGYTEDGLIPLNAYAQGNDAD